MNSKGSTVDEGVEPGYSIQEIAQLPVIIGSNEAGRLLRLSPRSVVRYAQKEEIPSIKIAQAVKEGKKDETRSSELRDLLLDMAEQLV